MDNLYFRFSQYSLYSCFCLHTTYLSGLDLQRSNSASSIALWCDLLFESSLQDDFEKWSHHRVINTKRAIVLYAGLFTCISCVMKSVLKERAGKEANATQTRRLVTFYFNTWFK